MISLKSLSLKVILRHKLHCKLTKENKKWFTKHFQEDIATLIKKWWLGEIERWEEIIRYRPISLIKKRKHGFTIVKDGDIKREEIYLFGVLHGSCLTSYSDTLSDLNMVLWKFGKKHGREVRHRNSRFAIYTISICDWKMGVKHGLEAVFYKDSIKVSVYLDGVKRVERTYAYNAENYRCIWRFVRDTEDWETEDWMVNLLEDD